MKLKSRHLKVLPSSHRKKLVAAENVERQKKGGGGGYKLPAGRNKSEFARQAIQDANNIKSNFTILRNKFSGNLNPTLIFEIKINQSVSPFINKIKIYGQPNGPNYDFFNTIESFQDIPAMVEILFFLLIMAGYRKIEAERLPC